MGIPPQATVLWDCLKFENPTNGFGVPVGLPFEPPEKGYIPSKNEPPICRRSLQLPRIELWIGACSQPEDARACVSNRSRDILANAVKKLSPPPPPKKNMHTKVAIGWFPNKAKKTNTWTRPLLLAPDCLVGKYLGHSLPPYFY